MGGRPAILVVAVPLLAAPAAPAPEPPATRVRTKVARVGHPGLERWPAADPTNGLARSIWGG